MTTAAPSRASQATSTVELFASFGIAVFPGPYGEKGSRAKDWPRIDFRTAREMTLGELRRREVNIVLRTGPQLAAIDIDGKDGIDPHTALEGLLLILPAGVAVYRTSRGFGVLLKPKRALGDGALAAYGAELFTDGHLVNIPPSRHPDGVDYVWVVPPGGILPEVDLEALGLVPEAPPAAGAQDCRRNGKAPPASPEDQRDFERLMAGLGIVPRHGGRETFRCTRHSDRERSLSVDWDACVFNDFSTGSACVLEGGGGIRKLRELVGEEPPVRPKQVSQQPNSISVVAAGGQRIDPEVERSRLVRAMKQSSWDWAFDRKTGRTLWEDVLECHIAQVKYLCDSGHRVALPRSCGFPLCPTCVPTRLRADFRRHSDNLPTRLALFRVTPPAGVGGRNEIGRWVRSWRRKSNLTAGFFGIRLRIERPDVLLVLPADQVPAGIVSDPLATLVAADVPLDEAVAWYVEMFQEEISSWRTPDEMLNLLAAVKGRRRFQGFGKYYANKEPNANGDDDQLFTGEPKKLYRASGGSAKGGGRALGCPICGSRMRLVGIAVSAEGMRWDSTHGCYLWDTDRRSTAAAITRPWQ